MPLLTQAEIARKHGVTRQAICKHKDALKVARRKIGNKILYDFDVFEAERSKSQNIRVTSEPESSGVGEQDYKTARTWVERYKAANQKLQYEIATKKYLLKSEVETDVFNITRIFRDGLLNIGPRITSLLAAEKDEHKILEILKTEHNSVLNEMVKAIRKVGK